MRKLLLILCAFVLAFSVCGCEKDDAKPVAKNVQEWVAQNAEKIDEYCKGASSDTHVVTIEAEDNTVIFNFKDYNMSDEDLQQAQMGALNDQEAWNKKSAEEKQEYLRTYVKTLEANGLEGMPLPDCLVTRYFDENDELIASTYFSK